MKNYPERAFHVNERIQELSSYTDTNNGIKRFFGNKSFIDCGHRIASWMREAGLETRIDAIGNIRGKLKSKNQDAKTLIIGSHFDTSNHNGQYEGVLGFVTGLELIRNIVAENIQLPFDIELIAFGASEGIRFNCPSIGSRAISGLFKNKFLQLKDQSGQTLSSILKSQNYDIEKIKDEAMTAEEMLGYFEIQMEETAFLSEQNVPVGIVSSILGEKRIEIEFIGEAAPAGITSMESRKDALAAASKFILSAEKYALNEKKKLRATVGKIQVSEPAANRIAGRVTCSLDIRSDDEKLLSDAYEAIYFNCEKICDKRNIYFEWRLIEETDPAICNKKLRRLLSNAIAEKNIPLINLESGSNLDAAVINKIAPVALLLIRSLNGNNREPLKKVEVNDIATALEITDNFIAQLSSEKLAKKKEK